MEADGRKVQVRSGSKSKRKDGKTPARSAAEEAKRREALKETLREKLELERRALQVVERLLEDSVTEDFLIDCAQMITPANYKDTVEERSIVKLCGYPVCANRLCNVPSQQFKISTKTNKVYDITERKCFCSNFCYKASKYFEVQIPKTPLWLRKEERPPDIKLMKEGDGGSSGLEIKLADQPVTEADVENPAPERHSRSPNTSQSDSSDNEQDFVSSVVSKQRPRSKVHWGKLPKHDGGSVDESGGREKNRTSPPHRAETQCRGDVDGSSEKTSAKDEISNRPSLPEKDVPAEHAVEETVELLTQCKLAESHTVTLPPEETSAQTQQNDSSNSSEPVQSNSTNNLNITQVGMSKKGAAGLKALLKGRDVGKNELPVIKLNILATLKSTLMEWRTEETFQYLYGPDYNQWTKTGEQREEESEEEPLDEDDLEVEDGDDVVDMSTQGEGSQNRPSAHVPDFETLRKETELLDLKVKEFYRGVCVLPEEVLEESVTENRESEDPVLPLVDSHAQNLIQKRIVVEKLSRSLRDIVGPLCLTMGDIMNDINSLVRTFRFTNTNIIHKNPEWTLIAIVLLSVLMEVSSVLRESLERPSSVEYISSLMKELRLQDQDLQSLVLLFKPHVQ
ncbi:putative RNA polymerase II subunit B1 CTD phosphatase rpap2 [Chanos chanos]|uniref:RNA polymerase II subunit B1 CTD phosphatase RPAP2 homolog n=1 Tax=Chanos chanos TaxID=29144 RepID=A0A6J2VI61_CHACN|nr:putative RNA polymerase II subunit B1 CTD phosphatase RPAP2 [Chanos chanos]